VFLWDVAAGTSIRRISGHMAKINVVEFNEDGSVVASGRSLLLMIKVPTYCTGSYDATVKLWDLRYACRKHIALVIHSSSEPKTDFLFKRLMNLATLSKRSPSDQHTSSLVQWMVIFAHTTSVKANYAVIILEVSLKFFYSDKDD